MIAVQGRMTETIEKEVDIWFAWSTEGMWPHSIFEPLMIVIYFTLSRTCTRLLGFAKNKWWELTTTMPYHRHQRAATYNLGITCANYGATRRRYQKCDTAWCAKFFVPSLLYPRGLIFMRQVQLSVSWWPIMGTQGSPLYFIPMPQLLEPKYSKKGNAAQGHG